MDRGPALKGIKKPNSAEAILKTVLREKGWTSRFLRNKLSGDEHLEVARLVRDLSKAWIRHEAQEFAQQFLGWDERSLGIQERADDLTAGNAFSRHVERFSTRVKAFIRESIVAGVLGLLGPRPLTGQELDHAERLAQVQAQYFDRFRDQVVMAPPAFRPEKSTEIMAIAPPMTVDQFIARAESYGTCVWPVAQEVARASYSRNDVFDMEHRVLGDAEHCDDCITYSAMGWMPIGALPAIGEQSACRQSCYCHFEYRSGPNGIPHTAGRGPMYDQVFGYTG